MTALMTVHGHPIIQRQNARAKRLILRFDETHHHFILTVPPRASQSDINTFLKTSAAWMGKQKSKKAPTISFVPGTTISILGDNVTLSHEPHFVTRSAKRIGEHLIIYGPAATFDKQCETYLKRLARKTFLLWCNDAIAHLPRSLFKKTQMTKLSLRDTTSRWGSCSSKGSISLSWRLIFAPTEVAKYVCIHECCHLIEMNHSDKFWRLVASQDPLYNAHRKWLKDHGKSLFAYQASE